MCYLGCVDETPNFPHFDLAQGPHTFLYGTRVKFVQKSIDLARSVHSKGDTVLKHVPYYSVQL